MLMLMPALFTAGRFPPEGFTAPSVASTQSSFRLSEPSAFRRFSEPSNAYNQEQSNRL